MNLSILWQYMQVDMEADRFETKMRQSENRQKLIKMRKSIKDSQASMSRLESEVADMNDRLDALADEADRLEKQLAALVASIEAAQPLTEEDAAEKTKAAQKLLDSISDYEQEMQRIRRDADQKDRNQRSIRSGAAKTLSEYNALKKVYDVEFAKDEVQLKKLRTATEREAKNLDAQMLETYKSVKQQVTPPIAKVVGGQCTGCFMSLPDATLLNLSGEKIIECDNCGRILYTAE